MNPFYTVYTEALFRPLFNLLVGIAHLIPGHYVGVAIILLTIVVRVILLPSALHQARVVQRNQSKMASVGEQLAKIKKQHAGNRAKQAEETMAVYKQAGINPASGCLPLLIQLPILLALYRVFLVGVGPDTFHYLYAFVPAPQTVSTVFLGIPLTAPSLLLGIIAGSLQFILMRFFTATPAPQPGMQEESAQMMASMQKNMMYIFPVMTVFIALQLPAALALYWVTSTLFAIIQQYFLMRFLKLKTAPPVV